MLPAQQSCCSEVPGISQKVSGSKEVQRKSIVADYPPSYGERGTRKETVQKEGDAFSEITSSGSQFHCKKTLPLHQESYHHMPGSDQTKAHAATVHCNEEDCHSTSILRTSSPSFQKVPPNEEGSSDSSVTHESSPSQEMLHQATKSSSNNTVTCQKKTC